MKHAGLEESYVGIGRTISASFRILLPVAVVVQHTDHDMQLRNHV